MGLRDELLRRIRPADRGFHLSFSRIGLKEGKSIFNDYLKDEQVLSDYAVQVYKDNNLTARRLNDYERNRINTFGFAALISGLEMAVFEHECPELLLNASTSPHLYRFLRAVELFSSTFYGGKALLVGSGFTIPEYLVLNFQPPNPEKIEEFVHLYKPGDLKKKHEERLKKTKQGESIEKPFDFKEGVDITAVEPDSRQLRFISFLSKQFYVDANKFHLHPSPIKSVIDKGLLPEELDTVLWHRADPLTSAAKPGDSSFDEQILNQLLETFYKHLKRGGKIIISIGNGNNENEYTERKRFISTAKQVLLRKGMLSIRGIPESFEENEWEMLFGNKSLGMRECIILRKK